MVIRPKAKQLTPELARQLLHNAEIFIGLRREYAKHGGATAQELAELARYENEVTAPQNYLKEQDNGHS